MRLSSLVYLGVVLMVGCASVPSQGSQQTALMRSTGTQVSYGELAAAANSLVVRVPGGIERAADEIAVRSTDPVIRLRALEWKIDTVAAFYQALLHLGPLEAMLDAWALALQLERFLDSGPGKEQFGEFQPVALAAIRAALADIRSDAQQLAKQPEGFDRARLFVERWAAQHPITGPLSSRPSILPVLASQTGKTEVSVWEAFGDVTTSLSDLSAHLDLYAAYLLRAARWQAELLMVKAADRKESQDILATLQSVHLLTERTNALISPEGLATALRQAQATLHREMAMTLADVDHQRVATLTYFTREREAAVDAITAQRVGAVADIDRERTLVMKDLDALRRSAIADVEGVLWRTVLRIAIVTALLLVLAAGLTLAVVSRARRRTPGAG